MWGKAEDGWLCGWMRIGRCGWHTVLRLDITREEKGTKWTESSERVERRRGDINDDDRDAFGGFFFELRDLHICFPRIQGAMSGDRKKGR